MCHVRINRRANISNHPLADPAHKVKTRGTRNTKYSCHHNQHQKILVDKLDILGRKPVHHAPTGHRKGKRGKRRNHQHDESRRQHGLVSHHKRDQAENGPDTAGAFSAKGFFFDCLSNRIGGVAHEIPNSCEGSNAGGHITIPGSADQCGKWN